MILPYLDSIRWATLCIIEIKKEKASNFETAWKKIWKRKRSFRCIVIRSFGLSNKQTLTVRTCANFFYSSPFAKYSGAIMQIFINTRNNNERKCAKGAVVASRVLFVWFTGSRVAKFVTRGNWRQASSRTTFFSSISRPFRLLFNANSEELCRPCSLYNGEDLYAILLRHRESLSLSLSLATLPSQISVKLNSK